jgi:hypothetical protein
VPSPCIPCKGASAQSIVDASVTVHGGAGAGGTLRALVFHHHPHFNALAEGVPPVTAQLALCGVQTAAATAAATTPAARFKTASPAPGAIKGTITWAGESSANFWPLWWADQKAANLSHANGDYTSWSVYSDAPPLSSSKAHAVFQAGIESYRAAAELQPSAAEVRVGTDGCVRIELELPAHEVALVEIFLN